jgi:hypothetical protein
MMMLFFIAAVLAVIGSLVLGITAMGRNGEVMHRTSAQWMTMRVVFQALAVGILLLMLLAA